MGTLNISLYQNNELSQISFVPENCVLRGRCLFKVVITFISHTEAIKLTYSKQNGDVIPAGKLPKRCKGNLKTFKHRNGSKLRKLYVWNENPAHLRAINGIPKLQHFHIIPSFISTPASRALQRQIDLPTCMAHFEFEII